MDSEQRKKKRKFRSPSPPFNYSNKSTLQLLCCLSLIFFTIIFLLPFHQIFKDAFQPVLVVAQLFSISKWVGIQDNFSSDLIPRVEDRILFPDHILLLLPTSPRILKLHQNRELCCVYYPINWDPLQEPKGIQISPVDSVDEYNSRTIARCPLPPANSSSLVALRQKGRKRENIEVPSHPPILWESIAYEALYDDNTAVVFVKGLNLRPDRTSDPTQFSCHFGSDFNNNSRFFLTTRALTAAQEVFRCSLPKSLRNKPTMANGVRVTISGADKIPFASVAKLFYDPYKANFQRKHEMCVCTMVWNQASLLREWIMYHSWLGVDNWFIYDNNSDDHIAELITDLQAEGYNVIRRIWPWIKTQEAGFSHCALMAKFQCRWVGFMDVDEFFYFPVSPPNHSPGPRTLKKLLSNYSSLPSVGEVRTTCHSFGPSGLSKRPLQGVTAGYTCRLQSPERHKSIIRPDAVDSTLLNVIHHFHLKSGFYYVNVPQSIAVINHYKYQVWDVFRSKFYRRVATYVADWQEKEKEGSKDRAPGLGTEAIEPRNWQLQFCEVWDSGLRDLVVANLADPNSGALPWENSL